LASAYLTAFEHLQKSSENPMSLAQLRDAALASNFDSIESMRAWLNRAVGVNLKYLEASSKHAVKALQLCPLQGQGYVYLAELQFLKDLDPQHPKEFLKQAKLVRPFSAQVQFVVGREALAEGRLEDALESWKGAFHTSRSYQDQILDQLVGTASAELILKSLEPNVEELERLEVRYREQTETEYVVVVRAYAEALKLDADQPECASPIDRILAAAIAYARLNELSEADLCFRKAIEKDRGSYVARRGYGVFLYQQQQYGRAAEHLQWCLRVNPTDDSLRRVAEDATNRGLRYESTILPAEFQSLGVRKYFK
jgi:tetratricopeptide (TPR) repeat protein